MKLLSNVFLWLIFEFYYIRPFSVSIEVDLQHFEVEFVFNNLFLKL